MMTFAYKERYYLRNNTSGLKFILADIKEYSYLRIFLSAKIIKQAGIILLKNFPGLRD